MGVLADQIYTAGKPPPGPSTKGGLGWTFCNIYMWGGRRKRSAVAAEARHLGRSVCVCGGGHRSRHRERGPGRRGVWESTSSRSPWLGRGGGDTKAAARGRGVGWTKGRALRLLSALRGSPRGVAGEDDFTGSLAADSTGRLKHERQEKGASRSGGEGNEATARSRRKLQKRHRQPQ